MLQQQQADLASQKQGAIDTAASRAGLINAPAAFLKQQAAQVAEPYGTASNKVASDANALNSYLGSMNAAHGNYLSELQAAIPLAQAQVDKAQSGNNLNQLMQLLNFKNAQEDRQYTLGQRDIAKQQQDKQIKDTAAQQSAFNSILNHSNAHFRDTGIDIINQSKDLPSALAALGTIKDGDLQKNGVNRDELRRVLTQYFDPETYAQLTPPPVIVAPTPAQPNAITTPAKPSDHGKNSLQNLLNHITGNRKLF